MIISVNGDILKSDCQIICHQVNCLGVMGAGLALQIKNKYPEIFSQYKLFVTSHQDKKKLLGKTLFGQSDDGKIFANVFAQYGVSRTERMTHYEHLKIGLEEVKNYAIKSKLNTIAIPYKIGCGLAGGDWDIVSDIIKDIFEENSDLTAKICKL